MTIQYKFNGTVVGVYLGLQADSLITTPQAEVTADFAGFCGDKHAGLTRRSDSRTPYYPRGTEIRNDRQVSIVSVEDLAAAAEKLGLPQLEAEWLGANLLIAGIPLLSKLPPNTRLFIEGGVTLVVTAENHPCQDAARAVQDQTGRSEASHFPKAARGLRGVVACVELPGSIRAGAGVQAQVPAVSIFKPDNPSK